MVMAVNATYANLSWDPPPPEHQNGLIELYHIAITEADTNKQLLHTSTDETTLIGLLHPYYTYKISVAAETVEIGPFTSQVSLKMPQAGSYLQMIMSSSCLNIFFIHSTIWNCEKCVSGHRVSQLCNHFLAAP